MDFPQVFQRTLKPPQAQYVIKVIEMEKTKIIALTAIVAALVAAVIVGVAYAQPTLGQGYASTQAPYGQAPPANGPTGTYYGTYGYSGAQCPWQGEYINGAYGAPQNGYAGYPVQSGMGMRGGMMGGYYP